MEEINKSAIGHFTELIVWQKNHKIILDVYVITKDFPKEEMFGLTNQIRRSASSVTANIAEGFGRYHAKDKSRFYIQARGSNTELQNHLILAYDLGYITRGEFNKLKIKIFEGYKLICGIIGSTKNFV